MWLNYGKNAMHISIAAVLALVLSAILADSPARAGLLKNSVKLGDRTKMTIVKKPTVGQRKRIIRTPTRPKPAPAAPEAGSKGGPGQLPGGALAWFWDQHSTDAVDASAERWELALASMRQRRLDGLAIYSRERLREIAQHYALQIAAAARAHNVSEVLLTAVIAVESAGRIEAVSSKGARGLMQLIPATAQRFGVANSFDPAQNILGGAAYLNWLLDRFSGDPILALAGYNAGEGAVDAYRGVPPYAETRDYVVKVFDALSAAETLCVGGSATARQSCGWPSAPES